MTMSPQMKKMLKIVSIVFGIIFGWYLLRKLIFFIFIATYSPPPVTISTAVAEQRSWQSFVTSVGTLTAINGVELATEASGTVKDIFFQSGQFVNKGDVLLTLDTSVEQAQLKDNSAKLKLAQISYERDQTLLKKSVGSQAASDTSYARLQEAEANVEESHARIKQKTIIAPFSGKIGIRQIDVGGYVPSGTSIVTLQALDPLYVRFSLPEQYVPNIYLQQPINVNVNLNLLNNPAINGNITAINAKVDQATRNILIQATIPNKNLQLYPGMFALVTIWFQDKKDVIVLPETAISYSLHGDSVFIIKDKGNKNHHEYYAYRHYVKVGERRNDSVVITKGIKAGDTVATSGQLKLQNETHVVIDNSVEL